MSILLLLNTLRRSRDEIYKYTKYYTFTTYTNINDEIYKYSYTCSNQDTTEEELQKKEIAKLKAKPVDYNILRKSNNEGIAEDIHTGVHFPIEKVNDMWNVLEGFEA
ncbi:hypothetical protein ACR77J_07135 [Tissierella praeacuta]|uniref:hypothetical protein n=1 Tax=Tissierella praeacuta TaxID=43131 RepID=UPI003DA49A54